MMVVIQLRQVRNNVFETNSSSSHSLVITTLDEHYTGDEIRKNLYIPENGIVRIWASSLEFYRYPFDILCTFESKARYAIASSKGKLVNEVEAIYHKYIPEFVAFKFDERPESYDSDNYVIDYGGTDDYCIEGWLKKYNITLEEFLTNRRYIVIVDGDEFCVWDHVKNTGLVDTDMIVHDSYKEYMDDLSNIFDEI